MFREICVFELPKQVDSELNYGSWPGTDLRNTGQLYFEY